MRNPFSSNSAPAPKYPGVRQAVDGNTAVILVEREASDAAGAYPDPIVTEIAPLTNYYPAENYHQDFFRLNPAQPYCNAVIPPKLAKLQKRFADKLASK